VASGNTRSIEQLVTQALTALHLMRRDEHYIVRDGKVQIVDEYTGRVMADRFWTDGLHQMIELKEGCAMSGTRVTLARMTYQKFFRRYRRLSGLSGTAREIGAELWSVYRLAIAQIPPNRPSKRRMVAAVVAPNIKTKWQLIAAEAGALSARGVPVLIGTRSVATSNIASSHLAAVGLDHVVLNASQDIMEAEIIGNAGTAGRITIATNMAGRGTDIRLADDARANGGSTANSRAAARDKVIPASSCPSYPYTIHCSTRYRQRRKLPSRSGTGYSAMASDAGSCGANSAGSNGCTPACAPAC
jgi:preprotein translocase subunit SecA